MKERRFGLIGLVSGILSAVALVCCRTALASGVQALLTDSSERPAWIAVPVGDIGQLEIHRSDRPATRQLLSQANPAATVRNAEQRSTPSAVPSPFPKSEAVLPTGKAENVWGPFEGQVVDADTGQGIPGAAVIVLWLKNIPNPVEGHEEFDDARWAVTKTEGQFSIPRRQTGPLRFPVSRGAFLSCVAPGYLPYEFSPKYDLSLEHARLREGAVILRLRRAPKVTHEQSIRHHEEFVASNLLSVPPARLEQLATEVNHERRLMGMRPILILYGELE